jgi:hypothetical protein
MLIKLFSSSVRRALCYFCLYFEYISLLLYACKLLQKSSEIQMTALTGHSIKNSKFIHMHIKEMICQYEDSEVCVCVYIYIYIYIFEEVRDSYLSTLRTNFTMLCLTKLFCPHHIIMPWHISNFYDFFKYCKQWVPFVLLTHLLQITIVPCYLACVERAVPVTWTCQLHSPLQIFYVCFHFPFKCQINVFSL